MKESIKLGILGSGQLETQIVKSAKKTGGIKTIILTDDKNGIGYLAHTSISEARFDFQ